MRKEEGKSEKAEHAKKVGGTQVKKKKNKNTKKEVSGRK